MPEEKKEINIDSTNIFDEFSWNEQIREEIKVSEKEKKKTFSYYAYIVNNFIVFVNMFFLLFFIILWWYIYIQNDKTIKNIGYLNPICNLFVNDKWNNENCSSVSWLIEEYEKENSDISTKLYEQKKILLEIIYENFKFINSKEINFLISKAQNRLKVLEILSYFDKIKNEFSPFSKTRILCSNINVSSDFIVEMQCTTYSWNWDWQILWYSWKNKWQDKVEWTSISIASSFINFLEIRKNSKFTVIDRPTKFNFIDIVNDHGYTKKTDFKLKLKYDNNNILQ